MDDLRTRLEIFSEDNNMSFTKIAKAMGVGASTLSEWRKEHTQEIMKHFLKK